MIDIYTSFSENVSASVHSQRNRKETESGGDDNGPNKPGGYGGNNTANNATVQEAANAQGNNSPVNAQTNANTSAQNCDSTHAQSNETAQASENNDVIAQAASENINAENVANGDETAKPTDNETAVSENAEAQKQGVTFGSVVKGTTRLATLPAGIMKDFIQGGVIVAGKNFIPRVMNVIKGKSIVSHADVPKIIN